MVLWQPRDGEQTACTVPQLHSPQLSVELCRPASSSGLGNEPREYSPTHILKRSPSSPNQRKCYIPWPHNPNNLSSSQCDSDTLPNKRMFLLPLLIASPRVSSTWPGIPSPTHDKLLGPESQALRQLRAPA